MSQTDKFLEQQMVGGEWIAIPWQGIDKAAAAFRIVALDGSQIGGVNATRRGNLDALSDLKFADQYGEAALAKRRAAAVKSAPIARATSDILLASRKFDRLYNEGGDGFNPYRR